MAGRDRLWVYGVLGGHAVGPPPCPGVDGVHDVELIRHAGLAALVSRVPLERFGEAEPAAALEDLRTLEVTARRHARVLDETLARGPVVPFPLGTVFRGPDGVRAMLAHRRAALAAALVRLQGMAEWGVKAYVPDPGPPDGAPFSGTGYLARLRLARAGVEARKERVAALHERLARHAAEHVLSASQDQRLAGRADRMILDAGYLVADAEAEGFRALVARLADEVRGEGIVLELSGPRPAYRFSEVA